MYATSRDARSRERSISLPTHLKLDRDVKRIGAAGNATSRR